MYLNHWTDMLLSSVSLYTLEEVGMEGINR